MKTILFGNGLNLLNGYSTWEDLLVRIDDKADCTKIPNTLQYEAEILPTPLNQKFLVSFDGKLVTQDGKAVTIKMGTETGLKTKIAEAMKVYQTNEIYQRLALMGDVTHYVTTNYDDVMRRTLENLGYSKIDQVKAENTYSIRRRVTLAKEKESQKYIWNIHGEIASPQTIMLGLHQYCGSVGKISEYLSGKYKYKAGKEFDVIPKIQERFPTGIEQPFSWIDLFFVSDVYIMGFGLLYEEIDLWWVLTRRKRLIRQGNNITNKVCFCGKVDPGKHRLLEIMGVEIIEPDKRIAANDYFGQYNSILDIIEKN